MWLIIARFTLQANDYMVCTIKCTCICVCMRVYYGRMQERCVAHVNRIGDFSTLNWSLHMFVFSFVISFVKLIEWQNRNDNRFDSDCFHYRMRNSQTMDNQINNNNNTNNKCCLWAKQTAKEYPKREEDVAKEQKY